MQDSDPSSAHRNPDFSERDAVRIAHDLFGLQASATSLESERDRNFRLETDTGESFVLKIAGAAEPRETLELQNRALEHLAVRLQAADGAERGTPCPFVVPTTTGESIATVDASDGSTHFVRLLSWLPGIPMARVRPQGADLLRSLGTLLGTLDRALQDFDHPAAHRDFYWDLGRAGRTVRALRERVVDRERRALIDRFLSVFDGETAPVLSELRTGVIHGDANDHNVLVTPHGRWGRRATRLIDFGDMVHTATICEPAIASAYAVLNKRDPLAAAAHVVAGYHAVHALTEDEISVLHSLICMRLCASVCIAAEQRRRAPGNEYLSISEKPAWEALRQLDEIHPRLAHYTYRHACGLDPVPRSREIVTWLRSNPDRIGPVVEADLSGNKVVFDLGIGSLELGGIEGDDTRAFTEMVFRRMREAGTAVGLGRYDEPRGIYTTEQFAAVGEELPQRRTIHLGIDLFMEPGTPVLAPLEGVVHGVHDNDARLDYGPTVILRHDAGGVPFYTLYGHLGPECLDELSEGMQVERGRPIATIGAAPRNGDWPAHLHLQIVTDLLDATSQFAGVAAPSGREVWLSLSPDPNIMLGIPQDELLPAGRDRGEILALRKRHLAPSLSTAYRSPLVIVRGRGQYLFDEVGHPYLDVVNNVCHVGHCHPRVVRAAQAQLAVLNTNTRYLHERIVEYAQRLCASMPDPLSVCMLVCSGSEANELALRMARAHTGRRGVITVDGAYHGHTQALIDVSPYKFDGPGGAGAPSWVRKVVMPDRYRGAYRGQHQDVGARYARHVVGALDEMRVAGHDVAAFICESILGCAGQVVLPDGYLERAYRYVRDAGGVCIADEVQVGFGRVGSRFWAFETQGVVPDIVTLGKPIGNGHPMAAVVTTPEIAESFANGMEYFSTFGGNPVSCAVGMAVLDVIEDEGLQQHARVVGARLESGLRGLMPRHPLIGDVRGLGLFLGVELVLDRQTLAPAPQHAARVIERMKDHGILISVDGPLHNVLKLKPPMPFDEHDADRVVDTLDRVLGEDALRP